MDKKKSFIKSNEDYEKYKQLLLKASVDFIFSFQNIN